MEHLILLHLGQMSDDDSALVHLYELQKYIDKINKSNFTKLNHLQRATAK